MTCLLDAFVEVPILAAQCCLIVTIRTLRLVCHGAKDAANAWVLGCTLQLGPDRQPDNVKLAALLSPSQLQRLHVKVPDISLLVKRMASVKRDILSQTVEFIAGAGRALSSVTDLTITIALRSTDYSTITSIADTSCILVSLAAACPKLQTLTLDGPVSPGALKKFGKLCLKLTALRITPSDLCPLTMQQLSTLLPRMTSLTALPSPHTFCNMTTAEFRRFRTATGDRIQELDLCAVLRGSPNLKSLHIGSLRLGMIWKSLLKHLTIDTLSCTVRLDVHPYEWQPHTGLRTLEVAGGSLDFCITVGLLMAAPNATVTYTSDEAARVTLLVECSPWEADGLVIFDERWLDHTLQLRTSSIFGLDGRPASYDIYLYLVTHQASDPAEDENNLGFNLEGDELVPIFDRPYEFLAGIDKALLSFVALEVIDDTGEEEGPDFQKEPSVDISDIVRVFPAVQRLDFQSLHAGVWDSLSLLSGCESLRQLSVKGTTGCPQAAVIELCKESKSLKLLRLDKCMDLDARWGHGIDRRGGKLSGVKLDIEYWR